LILAHKHRIFIIGEVFLFNPIGVANAIHLNTPGCNPGLLMYNPFGIKEKFSKLFEGLIVICHDVITNLDLEAKE